MKELLSICNMSLSDKYTCDNIIQSRELMLIAGQKVYYQVKNNIVPPVAIICGSGNNAGDGYVIAKLLKDDNIECELLLLEDKFSIDGKHYFDICIDNHIGYKYVAKDTDIDKYRTIFDCIFGTGFKGEVQDIAKDTIAKINNSKANVISVDINSGLNGDNGICSIAVKSDITVSIGGYKSGHFLNMAKDYIGELVNVDIGIVPQQRTYHLIEEKDVALAFPKRKEFSHKGTYGYIGLIGGSTCYSGAIKLAGIACTSAVSGAGVVKLCVPKTLTRAVLPYMLDCTLYPLSDNGEGNFVFDKTEIDKLISSTSLLAVGMGLGQSDEVGRLVKYLVLHYEGVLVLDADALNILAINVDSLQLSKAKIVLTPHLGEMSRLCKISIADIQDNPISIAENFAKKNGVIVVLKGDCNIITNGVETYISSIGTAGMARGGSGDVLSGIIAGLCGRKDIDLLFYVAVATYINGYSGIMAKNKYGEYAMLSSDTAGMVKHAISIISNH